MRLTRLYRTSPLGFVGAAVTGVMMGAFYGLGAVFARGVGLNTAGTALFMSATILGGVALQWPLGRLSDLVDRRRRSEEHTSELQSLMRISYAVFCLKNKTKPHKD